MGILDNLRYAGLTVGIVVGVVILVFGGFFASVFGMYAVVYALVEWGELDPVWETDFLAIVTSVSYDNDLFTFLFALLRIPIDQIQFVLYRSQEDDNYTADEEAHLLFFALTMGPILYLIGANFGVMNLFLTPILGLLYLGDTALFVDEARTIELGGQIPRPTPGLATWWSEYYSFLAM